MIWTAKILIFCYGLQIYLQILLKSIKNLEIEILDIHVNVTVSSMLW